MTSTMPASNGTQTSAPPPQPLPTGKRKRAGDTTTKIVNGLHSEVKPLSLQPDTQAAIREIYQVIESLDASLSILQHTLSPAKNESANEEEPSAKRTKLVSPPPIESIATKVQGGKYSSWEQLVSDVDSACAAIVTDAQSKHKGNTQWSYTPDTLERDRLVADATAIKRAVQNLMRRQLARKEHEPSNTSATETKPHSQRNGDAVNISLPTVKVEASAPDAIKQNSRTVLTLFGNAQGHKQLFSSFQKPVKAAPKQNKLELLENLVEPVMPLRENGLPNGISSTQIIPVPRDHIKPTKSTTFLDVFSPPAWLPSLDPPKGHKPATLKPAQSSITWAESVPAAPIRPLGYTHQGLRTGHWLGYTGVAVSQEPSTQELERKRRSRALSTGAATAVLSSSAIAAQTRAKEEALFRSAYSSFAPCRDNSAAIFPDELKNQRWWEKVGRQAYEQAFAIDPALDESLEQPTGIKHRGNEDEESAFKRAVELFQVEHLKLESQAEIEADKENRALLEEVSQLLETLHSYQRVRNSSLGVKARAGVGQNSTAQDLVGGPSTPSTAEIETYNVLKAQLALIVDMLPPHAIAKLNGEQLEELIISRRIPLEDTSYRGVMEEDLASRAAKAAAFNAAVGNTSSLGRPRSTMTPNALHYPQARTAQMTGGRTSSQGGQYYNVPPATLPRQSSSFSRQPLSGWQSQAQNYNGVSVPRPMYASQQSYGQQQVSGATTLRNSLPQYSSTRPGVIGQTPYQNTPTHQVYNGAPSQPSYQQRAQLYAANNTKYSTKSPYNAQQPQTPSMNPTSPQPTANQQQYARPTHSQPPQSISPAPQANTTRPQTPATYGQMNMGGSQAQQSQSPAPSAAGMGSGVSGTPQLPVPPGA